MKSETLFRLERSLAVEDSTISTAHHVATAGNVVEFSSPRPVAFAIVASMVAVILKDRLVGNQETGLEGDHAKYTN